MSGEDGDSPQSPFPHGLSHCRAALVNGDGSIQRKADHKCAPGRGLTSDWCFRDLHHRWGPWDQAKSSPKPTVMLHTGRPGSLSTDGPAYRASHDVLNLPAQWL